jgi:hypothetical protein
VRRATSALLLVAVACAAGLACSEALYRWAAARDVIARAFGRGELMAIAAGEAIYERDVADAGHVEPLIVAANLRRAARDEAVTDAEIERELQLLRWQFGEETAFTAALESSSGSVNGLRDEIADHLRAQRWIEKQIVPQLTVTDEEARREYEANAGRFAQPPRFRASHLFLAATNATPPDVIEAKQRAIKAHAAALAKGADFAQLVAEASEDEATKTRGGDLGFFASTRMPADFIGEVEKLQPGTTSAPVRTLLGFHLLQLTDARPARQMPFDEVRSEIGTKLASARRAAAVEQLAERLRTAEFIRPPL